MQAKSSEAFLKPSHLTPFWLVYLRCFMHESQHRRAHMPDAHLASTQLRTCWLERFLSGATSLKKESAANAMEN